MRPVGPVGSAGAMRCFSYNKYEDGSEEPWPIAIDNKTLRPWYEENYHMYPPQDDSEVMFVDGTGHRRRRATYCHSRDNIKYSPKKMWYIACLTRGLSVDEAIKQCAFVPKKGAHIMREVLNEAREIALNQHNFEYKSDMYVGEANVQKGLVIKGVRKHAFFRLGEVRYFHCHIMLRLVEGPPPDYFYHKPLSNRDKLEYYMDELRRRKPKFTL